MSRLQRLREPVPVPGLQRPLQKRRRRHRRSQRSQSVSNVPCKAVARNAARKEAASTQRGRCLLDGTLTAAVLAIILALYSSSIFSLLPFRIIPLALCRARIEAVVSPRVRALQHLLQSSSCPPSYVLLSVRNPLSSAFVVVTLALEESRNEPVERVVSTSVRSASWRAV